MSTDRRSSLPAAGESPLPELRRVTERLVAVERAHAIERARHMEQLTARDAQFRALFDASFDGLVVHHLGSIVYANLAFASMMAADPALVVGSHLIGYFAADSLDEASKVLCSPDPTPVRLYARRRDGVTYPLLLKDVPHEGNVHLAILRPLGG